MRFSGRELRDLLVAWLALGVAFTLYFERLTPPQLPEFFRSGAFLTVLASTLATVGLAFLLHELAHKVVAVRFGQVAEFRADYTMLGLAVAGGLAGFIFAAPGAVHHRGRLTDREHGLIALAGPVTNLLLAGLFVPVALADFHLGLRGVGINLLLAGFNMLPFGPLDGRTVIEWSYVVYSLLAIPCIGLAAFVLLFGVGL